jgi:adenylate cyclase
LVFGLLFGAAAFYRVDPADFEGELRWPIALRQWVDRLEFLTLDWRLRELGGESQRSDDVVIIAVDEETMENARVSSHADWAMRPWPRDLLGGVAEQALKEGAALIVLDEPLSDVSPHRCAPCKATDRRRTDDALLGDRFERLDSRIVVGMEWGRGTRRPPERQLTPFLVLVSAVESEREALPVLRSVLVGKVPAFLEPRGQKWLVWAGATSEANARELTRVLNLSGSTIRAFSPDDVPFEVDLSFVAKRLAQVTITGNGIVSPSLAGTIAAPVPELLVSSVGFGASAFMPEFDGIVRSMPVAIGAGDAAKERLLLSTVPLRAAMMALKTSEVSVTDGRISLAGRPGTAIDAHGRIVLRWDVEEVGRGGRGSIKRTLPAWRLLVNSEDDAAGRGVRHYDNELTGKVVLLSDERANGTPRLATPVGEVSRAAVNAQAILNLLRGDGLVRSAPELDFWMTVAFAGIGAVLAIAWSTMVRRPGWLAWLVTLTMVAGVQTMVARQMAISQQRWVPLVLPVLAFSFTFLSSLGYARSIEHRLREFVLSALGGAVRADLFRRVERDLALMHPERRLLTVYFSDIEGFTRVAERIDPKTVVQILRDYLAEMTTVVLDRSGHVDKYLGDGLMAFWGAPVSLENVSETACEAALYLQETFEKHKAKWETRCGQPLSLRAGMDSGPTVVGEMGTQHRVNYTVMGAPVANAYRLEALAKTYGVRILVGEVLMKDALRQFVFREVDVLRSGHDGELTRMFELVGRKRDAAAALGWVEEYASAMDLWQARRFEEAKAAFEVLSAARPNDALIARYVKRCVHYVEMPPKPEWDGVYEGPGDV